MLNTKVSKAVRLAIAFGAASTAAFSANTFAAGADNDKAEEEKVEKIQVVGSRIRTDSFASDTPIDIISVAEAESEGIKSLGDLLRTSTAASGSNQVTSALSVGYVTNGGSGTETASLRGLGASRTLVLLNGRRAGPAGTRGAVSSFDLNSIPLSAIERVEILKDGASAMYGSDAVAGVINIITKKGDESSINLDISQPFESGGEDKRINVSFGKEFSEGSFRVTADYKIQSYLKRGDRDFYDCAERLYYNEDGTRADPISPKTGKPHCAESAYGIWVYGRGAENVQSGGPNLAYDYDGWFAENNIENYNDTATTDADLRTPNGWYPVSFDKASDALWDVENQFRDMATMTPETKVWSVLATGEYNLTDDIVGYAELIHSKRTTSTENYRQFWTADIGSQPTTNIDGFSGQANLLPVAISDHYSSETIIDYSRVVLGATGSIGFWDWDVSFQSSHNSGDYNNDIFLRDSLLMAQGHFANGTSCSGEVTEFSKKQCVDVDWTDPQFLAGYQTDAQKDFLFGTDHGNTNYKQQTLEGYITGDLLELPAGSVGAAFGFTYQTDYINDVPGENTLNGNSWGLSGAGITSGDQNTRAVYAEFKVPVLADVFLAESLDLSFSTRWTDVSTYGNDTTYSLGLNWTPFDGLSIRGGRGSSFRSPALFELYLANQSGFSGQRTVDPCLNWGNNLTDGTITQLRADNCKAAGVPATYETAESGSATVLTSGGAGRLFAETSVNETIGFVWTSPEDTYAVSVDYYNIVIENEVTRLSGDDITFQCFDSTDFANEPLCDLFDRKNGGTTGNDFGITEIRSGYVNVANQNARGVDYNFTYNDDFDFGSIRFKVEHTMQIERMFKTFENSVENNSIGEMGRPKHTGRASLTYSVDDYSFTWTANYFDSTNNYEYNNDSNLTTYRGEEVRYVRETPWVTYHSASGNVRMDNGLNITVGVANLFDKEPPAISQGLRVGSAALYSQYDRFGRRLFANVKYTF